MNTAFPFGFPFATGFYLTCYVLTMVLHVVFMNYVLAGSAYVTTARVFTRGDKSDASRTVHHLLMDWLPFSLSAAITAGVAPLLFLQILYQHGFYTANLLLFHRWMIFVPVLIVGFYLLYVWKSRPVARFARIWRVLIGLAAFGCFAFTAYSWTENHLLSVASQGTWTAFHASKDALYHSAEIAPRLAVWFVGAFPTMFTLVAWQLWSAQRHEAGVSQGKRVAWFAIAGLLLSAICAGIYYTRLAEARQAALTSPLARPFLYLAAAGGVAQLMAWVWQARYDRFAAGPLALASAGLLATLLGATVLREALRLEVVDITALYPRHEAALGVGGLPVFLTFFVLCAAAIGFCLYLARRGAPISPGNPD